MTNSEKEVSDGRLWNLLRFSRKAEYGSIHWVTNRLWSENSKNYAHSLESKEQSRKHPGLSTLNDSDPYSRQISMYFGTSKKSSPRRSFSAHIQPKTNPEKTTYFLTLEPVEFNVLNFFSGDIEQNEEKTRLSENECRELKKFLKRRLS